MTRVAPKTAELLTPQASPCRLAAASSSTRPAMLSATPKPWVMALASSSGEVYADGAAFMPGQFAPETISPQARRVLAQQFFQVTLL